MPKLDLRKPSARLPPPSCPPAFCATSPRRSRRSRKHWAGRATPSMPRRELNRCCASCFRKSLGCCFKAGDDLGDALFGATRDLLLAGHDCVLLVNGDSPTLPSRFLVQAIEALRGEGDRLVLGPASDGGYYLIGLKSPAPATCSRKLNGEPTPCSDRTCERAAEIGLADHSASGMVRHR